MRLNLGIIGKYHKTLAGDNFFLYRGAPQLGHSFNAAYSFRNKTQSFGHACILSLLKPIEDNIFLASYVRLGRTLSSGSISFIRANNSVKLLSDHPLSAFKL